jgi:hypothetical protein
LLDAADDEFSFVSQKLKVLKEDYKRMILRGDLDIPLNADALDAYLEASPVALAIYKAAEKAGFQINPGDRKTYFDIFKRTAEYAKKNNIVKIDADMKDFSNNLEAKLSILKNLLGDNKSFTHSGILRLAFIVVQPKETRQRLLKMVPPTNFSADNVVKVENFVFPQTNSTIAPSGTAPQPPRAPASAPASARPCPPTRPGRS